MMGAMDAVMCFCTLLTSRSSPFRIESLFVRQLPYWNSFRFNNQHCPTGEFLTKARQEGNQEAGQFTRPTHSRSSNDQHLHVADTNGRCRRGLPRPQSEAPLERLCLEIGVFAENPVSQRRDDRATGMRKPQMHGTPPIWSGRLVMRGKAGWSTRMAAYHCSALDRWVGRAHHAGHGQVSFVPSPEEATKHAKINIRSRRQVRSEDRPVSTTSGCRPAVHECRICAALPARFSSIAVGAARGVCRDGLVEASLVLRMVKESIRSSIEVDASPCAKPVRQFTFDHMAVSARNTEFILRRLPALCRIRFGRSASPYGGF